MLTLKDIHDSIGKSEWDKTSSIYISKIVFVKSLSLPYTLELHDPVIELLKQGIAFKDYFLQKTHNDSIISINCSKVVSQSPCNISFLIKCFVSKIAEKADEKNHSIIIPLSARLFVLLEK